MAESTCGWPAHTQEEIAEAVGVPRQTVTDQIDKFAETVLQNQSGKAAASHLVDFDVPLYNVWNSRSKTRVATTNERWYRHHPGGSMR